MPESETRISANLRNEVEIIVNSTHDGIIAIDVDGRISLFNHAAEQLTGKRAAEVLGAPIDEVIPSTRLPIVLRSGEPELNWQQTLGDIMIITSRMPLINESGAVIGAFAVFRDISQIVELAEQITDLREMRIMWEAIFSSTQDAISVVNEHGVQISVNPAYTRVTGYSKDEVVGQPCTIDIATGESVHMKVLQTREPVKNARLRVGPHAKEVVVDAAPIVVRGELKGSVAVIKDLTEIVYLNKQLRTAHQIIRKLEAKYSFDDIIGKAPSFSRAVEKAKVAAKTPATVLLHGESGTGKELFAHAIHNASDRAERHFVRVNCASLSEGVLESELFGYEEGAFTGAQKGGKVGLFEEADGGTIFLDEIGIMSLNTQAQLLRVLQENEVRRVGGTRTIPVNVRVIAATNLDLRAVIADGRFREDLYYRLEVIPIEIPALRDRREDIPQIAEQMVRRINQEYGRGVSSISPRAMEVLRRYPWPGNIRELENVLRRAMINLSLYENVISDIHLPDLGPERSSQGSSAPESGRDVESYEIEPLKPVVEEYEAGCIAKALRATGGNRSETARRLGVSLRSLQYKINRYKLGDKS